MLRIEIYQESAHYRMPTIGNPYLTYPLVPPSTFYGFLRGITKKESINHENTKLAISGKYQGVSIEKERLYLEKSKGSSQNIISIQCLHQVRSVVFVVTPFEFENKIVNGFNTFSGAMRLGRQEDLIIDYSISKIDDDVKRLTYPSEFCAYANFTNDRSGALFNMPYDSLVDENKNITGYRFINLLYMPCVKMDHSIEFIGDGFVYS
ncbi:MAG TPA: CRISPR-associated protein Cas5 [Smithellaceae bacterium]|nr:CRISPR-associated protein Cas5 [Smithellaceae bacterium]